MGWLTALREDIYPATPFPAFADGATFGLPAARVMASHSEVLGIPW